jgi:phospholipid/cholesterol/gamma-HCH transport system substrate-binding protein
MSRNVIETVMGAVVLVIAGSFLVTAYEGRSLKSVGENYKVKALFENATGISVGSDVRLGGVKIGVVDRMELDTSLYQAAVTLAIREGVPLPSDSTAAVLGDGLLGGKFVDIQPGAEEETLKDGGMIEFTQSSVSFEEMIGKFVFSGGGVEGEGEESAPEAEEEHVEEKKSKKDDAGTREDDELNLGF